MNLSLRSDAEKLMVAMTRGAVTRKTSSLEADDDTLGEEILRIFSINLRITAMGNLSVNVGPVQ